MVINKILYVVNVDWFFVSHRLPLAIEALRKKNTQDHDKCTFWHWHACKWENLR